MNFSRIKKGIQLLLIAASPLVLNAQNDTINNNTPAAVADSTDNKGDIIKTGYNFVPIPDFRYDPYAGVNIGAVGFLYNFGDGKRYPNFYHSTVIEASYTTKGATNFRVRHKRFGDIISYAEVFYQNQIAAPYFGVNGFQQSFNQDYLKLDGTLPNSPNNPLFYNYQSRFLQLNFELQDTIKGTKNLNWLGSIYSGWYDVDEIDFGKVNKGIDPTDENYIPDTAATLYGLNRQWGIADSNKLEGGNVYAILKAELIYDKRDRITNPLKGVLSRVGIAYSPRFKKNGYGNLAILNASHTHYVPLIKQKLFRSTFAYRIKYVGYLGGQLPYPIQEGLGGQRSAWGVHQNRAMVKQWTSGQFELRTRAFGFKLLGSNFDFWGGPFFHTGYVIQEDDIDMSKVSAVDQLTFFNTGYDRWYSSYGFMGKMVINKNIVLGTDFAFPANAETGPPLSVFIGSAFSFIF